MKLSKGQKVFVSGHGGMVGSAIVRALGRHGFDRVTTADRNELDLTDQGDVRGFIGREEPDVVVVAAAKVGGIYANATYPADFLYQNLMIAANLVEASFQVGVGRLLFLGSSCIYPKFAEQPMVEDCLLSGPLEPTNEAYAVAKIAGLKLCQHYRAQHGVIFHSAMPTNLYGPGDNYHPENSHVIPGLLRRFHEAKESGADSVTIWGTGEPKREFLYVDDLADACLHLLQVPAEKVPDWVNIGFGEDVSIRELAGTIKDVVGFGGAVRFDTNKPDGTPRKLMDSTKVRALGWEPATALREGLETAYRCFVEELTSGVVRSA